MPNWNKSAVTLTVAICAIGAASYFFRYELWLARHLLMRGNSFRALLQPSDHIRIVGHLRARAFTNMYPYLDAGTVRNAVPVHPDGCFVLAAPGTKGTYSVLADGFKRIEGGIEAGYYRLFMTLADVDSGQNSQASTERISVFEYLWRMRRCHQSD